MCALELAVQGKDLARGVQACWHLIAWRGGYWALTATRHQATAKQLNGNAGNECDINFQAVRRLLLASWPMPLSKAQTEAGTSKSLGVFWKKCQNLRDMAPSSVWLSEIWRFSSCGCTGTQHFAVLVAVWKHPPQRPVCCCIAARQL